MNKNLENIYHSHHVNRRGRGFVILGEERGAFLQKHIGQGKKVLDIGCRDGTLTKFYKDGNDVLGLDIDSASLNVASSYLGIKVKQVDLNGDWGLGENIFDVVVAAEIIEHLYYPETVLEKIAKVLKDNGTLVGSIPHAFSLQARIRLLLGTKSGTALQDPTHINHFFYKDFKKLLANNFKDIEIESIVSKKFKFFNYFFPNLFTHTILFKAVKK